MSKEKHMRLNTSSKSKQHKSLSLLAALSCGLYWAIPAFGADITPIQTLDTTPTGGIIAPDSLGSGHYAVSFSLKETGSNHLDPSGKNNDIAATDSGRASLIFSAGLTSRLQLSIGLHATKEVLPEQETQTLFQNPTGSRAEETAFSNGSLLIKYSLNAGESPFKANLGLFVESGAGEKAAYSATRSQSPKGGWLLSTAYEGFDKLSLALTAGMRYRNPETLGQYRLRNEIFYETEIKGDVSSNLAIFAAGTGRRLMLRDDLATTPDEYKPQTTGEYRGGLIVNLGATQLTAFGGTGVQSASFGHGRKIIGLSLLYEPAATSSTKSTPKVVEKKIKKQRRSSLDEDAATSIFDELETIEKSNPKGKDEEPDDFEMVEQELNRENKKYQNGYDDSVKLEEELDQLRAEDAKREAAEEKARLAEEKRMREKRAKFNKQYNEEVEDLREEVRDDIDKLPDITDEEVRWNGLD